MKFLRKVQEFLKLRLSISFTEDDHYNKALRSIYFFGFFEENVNLKQKLTSLAFFAAIFLNVYLGCVKQLYESLTATEVLKSTGAVVIFFRHTIFLGEFVSFIAHQTCIREMIKVFHDLKSSREQKSSKFCDKLIKAYRVLYLVVITIFSIFNIFLSDRVKFFLPTIYESAARGLWFPVIYFFHIIHFIIYILVVISIDLLPIVSILKLQGLVPLLCEKVKEVTNGNKSENEKNLDECISFHVEIIA